MRTESAPRDGAVVAMLQDATIVAVIAARRWHQFRQHDQQVIAGRRAIVHL
ncbi:hypothetical protein [Streptomyces puniciscabiei]|uniref:hypothetical protein n=1 Tax=Streptomyces puniciscabiei TaxID=164348 RepID=UPI000AD96F59|nr:hypothetical protein [Streptomyces puniciscabiei]